MTPGSLTDLYWALARLRYFPGEALEATMRTRVDQLLPPASSTPAPDPASHPLASGAEPCQPQAYTRVDSAASSGPRRSQTRGHRSDLVAGSPASAEHRKARSPESQAEEGSATDPPGRMRPMSAVMDLGQLAGVIQGAQYLGLEVPAAWMSALTGKSTLVSWT